MRCPHCNVEIHADFRNQFVGQDVDGAWQISKCSCPSCQKLTIFLCKGEVDLDTTALRFEQDQVYLVYPRGIARSPLPADVPAKYAQDYREACLVLADSPKASAALSRRCLQLVLLDAAKTKEKRDLDKQIAEVLPSLPSYLSGLLDSIRVIGNFAAHPAKHTNTGEIIDVEPGEAELLLDVLETVFDFYFVQPAEVQRKRDAINEKLKAAGKNKSMH